MGSTTSTGTRLLAPVILLAVPLCDTAMAILRRIWRGRPVFSADHDHFHHRLAARGYSPHGIAGIAAAVGVVCAIAAILVRYSAAAAGTVVVILWLGGIALALSRLGYLTWSGLSSALTLRRRSVALQRLAHETARRVADASTFDNAWFATIEFARAMGAHTVALTAADDIRHVWRNDVDPLPRLRRSALTIGTTSVVFECADDALRVERDLVAERVARELHARLARENERDKAAVIVRVAS